MLGVICGMAAEAAALGPVSRDPRVRLRVVGADPDRAESEAELLIDAGCTRLLSWGVCGGLDPELAPGALVIGDGVVEADGTWHALAPLSVATVLGEGSAPPEIAEAALLGVDRALLGQGSKASAFARHGTAAVDMETHRIARAADRRGVPVVALRAVADPAERELPRFVADAVGPQGRPALGRVLKGLALQPHLLFRLLRLARDRSAALATLRRIATPALLEALLAPERGAGAD